MYGDSTFHSDICFPYDLAAEWTVLCLLDECVSFGNLAAQIIYPCCVCSLAVNVFYSPDFDHGYICQYVLLPCEVFSFSWQSQCKSLRVSKSLQFSTLCCLCCCCHFWELMPHTGLWYLLLCFCQGLYNFSDSIFCSLSRLFWGLWVPCHFSIRH